MDRSHHKNDWKDKTAGTKGRASRTLISLLALFFFVLWLTPPVQGASFADTAALKTSLFTGYDPDLRPFVDSGTPLNVYMGLWLTSIQELDEINQALSFGAILYVEWTDIRLAWDSASHNGTMQFSYPQKNLWVPDITILNSVETMGELGFGRNFLVIDSDGTVVWYPGGVYKTSCDIDVTYYPFDYQTCEIIFSTLTSTSAEINIDADPTYSVFLDRYASSGSWDLISVQTSHILDTSTRTKISFKVNLKRLSRYYVVSIIIPILFLSFTATLVFALPVDSGEKMGTAITVLLAFAVYLTIVSEQMPKTSLNVSVLSLYISTLLGQTALGVVLSVWILNLHYRHKHSRPGPGRFTRTVTIFLQRLMRKRPWKDQVIPIKSDEMKQTTDNPVSPTSVELAQKAVTPVAAFSPETNPEPENMKWKQVAYTFDRFLFYTFTAFLVLFSVVFLTTLAAGGAINS